MLRTAAEICAVLLAVVVLDAVLGRWHRTGTVARLYVTPARSGTPTQALVAFPGYTMSGGMLSAAFAPHLGADDAMVVVEYAQRGVDPDAIHRAVTAELARLGAPSLRVYGGSMGGMCAKHFLDRYLRDGAPYGKVVLVVDTSPSGPADVRRPRWLMALGRWYLGGPVGSGIWALASVFEPRPVAEATADAGVVAAFRRATARVGMPAIASQAGYVSRFPALAESELVPVVERFVYLHGDGYDRDPVVRVGRAIEGWRRAYPELTPVCVPQRQGRWHLPLIERPAETVRAILAG